MAKKYENLPIFWRSKSDPDLFKEELRSHLVPKQYKLQNFQILSSLSWQKKYENLPISCRSQGDLYSFKEELCSQFVPQLFQPLGEKLSYYNEKWFSSHHFGFKSSRKLKFY